MNKIIIDVMAKIENVTFARGALATFLIDFDLTISSMNEIKTIVSEAITNAIVHGYQNNKEKFVHLEYILENDLLTIIVKDEGVGIEDVNKAREPLFTTKLEEERAGLGFTIMEMFADEIDVISKIGVGTTVICRKKLSRNE